MESYTASEVAKNNGKNGQPCWIIIKGSVYDVSKMLKDHPGGEDIILDCGGKDATKAFNEVGHSTDAMQDMKLYKIGVVVSDNVKTTNSSPVINNISTKVEPQQQKSAPAEKEGFKLFCCC
ncbi:cytochrome b5 [Teleopsis dalmanni]|uniref:cytochrome b5 n=1 Tax=Teleopsis dalmanni TaxID=139649 RepID=UPI0018CE1C7B|nr:cytochrome b5 [Teleopsis dalmanni]